MSLDELKIEVKSLHKSVKFMYKHMCNQHNKIKKIEEFNELTKEIEKIEIILKSLDIAVLTLK